MTCGRFLAGRADPGPAAGRWEIARRTVRRHRTAMTALAILAIAAVAILAGISRYEARIRETREAGRPAVRRRFGGATKPRAAPAISPTCERPNRSSRAITRVGRSSCWTASSRPRRDRPARVRPALPAGAMRYLAPDPRRLRRAGLFRRVLARAATCWPRRARTATVRIWKTGSWELLRSFRADKTEVNVATFSPDGTLLATVGDEGTLKLWEVATGRCRFERPAHRGDAVVARFTPDGQIDPHRRPQGWTAQALGCRVRGRDQSVFVRTRGNLSVPPSLPTGNSSPLRVSEN